MSDMDNGSIFISITDDDGNEYELEHLDTTTLDDRLFMLFLPADMSEDDPDYGYIILEVLQDEGSDEQYFGDIEDETLLQRVYDTFMEQLFDEEEDEEDEE